MQRLETDRVCTSPYICSPARFIRPSQRMGRYAHAAAHLGHFGGGIWRLAVGARRCNRQRGAADHFA